MSDIEKIRCKNPRCRGRWIAEVRYVGTMGFPVPLRWNGKPRRFNAVLHVYGPKARLPATKPLVAGHASPRNVTEEAAWVEAGASAIWVNADGEPVTFHGDQGEEGILVRADRDVPDELRPYRDRFGTVNTMEFRCRKCGGWTTEVLRQR